MLQRREKAVSFALEGRIVRADLDRLSCRICALLDEHDADVAFCEVRGDLDAVTVDALCRLQLVARRRGCTVRLTNASGELLELVAFMGLADVLRSD
jgi:ABC-type transporter Mla MlaB component